MTTLTSAIKHDDRELEEDEMRIYDSVTFITRNLEWSFSLSVLFVSILSGIILRGVPCKPSFGLGLIRHTFEP
ncbi:hypothetical protein LA080_011848 [Diaporthe eres]|nr:hypothetical protein LA080_011848 [Diaporthe eres]